MMRTMTTHLAVAVIAAMFLAGAVYAEDDAAQEPDIPALVAQLAGPKYYEREYALTTLLNNSDKATPAMLAALESADYNTRIAAVKFFDAKATPEFCPQLLEILKRSKETEVVAGLSRILAHQGRKDAVEQIRALFADRRPAVLAAAVDSLAVLGDRDSAATIALLLNDDFSEVRVAAAKALAAFRAVDLGKDVFAAFEKEKIPEVQRALVESLGELKFAGAVPPLLEAIKDEHSPIFLPAVYALAKIGGDEARDALVSLLMNSKDLEMLSLASSALGVMGESAVPALEAELPALKDDLDGRFKILSAFGKMGKYVIPYLIAFIENEPYPIWRGQAGDKLRAIIKREYGEDIDFIPAYDDPDKTTQEKIAQLKQWWEEHKSK